MDAGFVKAGKDPIQDVEMLTIAQLAARGWSKTMIDMFLGKPDKVKHNPFCSARPMRHYRMERVVATEALPEFIKAKGRATNCSNGRKRGIAARRLELQEKIAAMPVMVQSIDRSVLWEKALQRHGRFLQEKPVDGSTLFWEPTTLTASIKDLHCIQVTYIWHHLVEYDRTLQEEACKNTVADMQAVGQIVEKIYHAIAAVYPDFASECERQIAQARQAILFRPGYPRNPVFG